MQLKTEKGFMKRDKEKSQVGFKYRDGGSIVLYVSYQSIAK